MGNENHFEDIKHIIEDARQVALNQEEKRVMRVSLERFIRQNPILPRQKSRNSWLKGIFFSQLSRPSFMYGSLVVLVMVLGFGVSVAARQSLPGDFLYPIKTGVTEKVLPFFAVSDQARAQLYISLANARLEEVEQVASSGSLNSRAHMEAESLVAQNIEKAQASIHALVDNQDDSTASQFNAKLEGTLQAHAAIINALPAAGSQDELGQLGQTVSSHIQSVSELSRDGDSKIAQKESGQAAIDSKYALAGAQDALASAGDFLSAKASQISVHDYDQANSALVNLQAVLGQGRQLLEAGEYAKAFADFQQVIQGAQTISTGVSSSIKLKIPVPILSVISPENDSDGGEPAMNVASDNSASLKKEDKPKNIIPLQVK